MKGLMTDNGTGDLLTARGGAPVADCEEQIIETVLLAGRGELKELPLIGAEARKQVGGERDVLWPGTAKKMIRACGVEVRKVSLDENDIITVE